MKGNRTRRTYRAFKNGDIIYEGNSDGLLQLFEEIGYHQNGSNSSRIQVLRHKLIGTEYKVARQRFKYVLEKNGRVVSELYNFTKICYETGYSACWWGKRMPLEEPIHKMRIIEEVEWV